MTAKELFDYSVNELSFTECGEFETKCLFETLLGINKTKILMDNSDLNIKDTEKIFSAIKRRKNGTPLQYILGEWDFYDMTFLVGEGVLIPRPETEMLVDFALEKIKSVSNPVVFDLCAGTGCIGLTIAKHRNDARVFLFEKEDKAFYYLNENVKKYNLSNVTIIKCDILDCSVSELPDCDILVSNPPYIATSEIAALQQEVLREPITALDGGFDGLLFYRGILQCWAEKVVKGGYIAFECGEEQSTHIVELYKGVFSEEKVIFDFNDIDRIVTFRI